MGFFIPVTPLRTLLPSILCVLHGLPADNKTHIFNIPILWDTEQMVRNHLSMGKWKLRLPKDSKPTLCCKHLAMPLRRKVSENSWCLCFKGNISRAKFFYFFFQKACIFLRGESSKSPLKKLNALTIYATMLNLEKQKSILLLKDKVEIKGKLLTRKKRKEQGHTRQWPVPTYNRNTPALIR